MPPKAKPKPKSKGGSEEEEKALRLKIKRTKEVLEEFFNEANVPFDQNLLNKVYDSQGWPRTGCPEVPVASQKLIVSGDENAGQLSPEDSEEAKAAALQAAETAAGIKAAGKALRVVCPLHCVLNSICYWRVAVCDEGLKGLADFATKVKPGTWEGLVNLELQECQITAKGCDLLSEKLQENIPLRSLVLDFNRIGDRGAALLAEGLRSNSNLATLRLAYCALTAKSGEALASGMVRGSKIRNLDVRGNQLGTYVTSSGQTVKGSGVVPMFSGMRNQVLWRGASEEELQRQIKAVHQARPADPAQAAPKGGGDALPGVLRAGAGPWAGWEIFSATETHPTEGEEFVLYAVTETLRKLDLSDNCITEDLQVHGLTLTCSATKEDAFFSINETAVEIGAALIHEGSYLQIGKEMVRVTCLRPAATCLLSDDIDPLTNVLPMPDKDQALLQVRPGSLLRVGKETVAVRAVRPHFLLVNRAQAEAEASKHAARTKITRATEMDVVRGCCFTEPGEHEEEARLLRVSAIQHMVDMLRPCTVLTDLLLESNKIGQEGAEMMLEPTRRLAVFTVTGQGVQESLFKELYKDGTAKKKGKKGGKKKK